MVFRKVPQGVPAHIRFLVLQRTSSLKTKTSQYVQHTWRKQHLHLSLHHHWRKQQLHCAHRNSPPERHHLYFHHRGRGLTAVQTPVLHLEHRGRIRITGLLSFKHIFFLIFLWNVLSLDFLEINQYTTIEMSETGYGIKEYL